MLFVNNIILSLQNTGADEKSSSFENILPDIKHECFVLGFHRRLNGIKYQCRDKETSVYHVKEFQQINHK